MQPRPINKANIGFSKSALIMNYDVLSKIFATDELKPIDWSSVNNPVGRRLVSPVRNQQQCGNCWAMSSTDTLADRIIIKSALAGKKVGSGSLKLQPAVTTQCTIETADKGCDGGSAYYAGKYFEISGCPEIRENMTTWNQICSDGCTSLPSCADIEKKISGKIWKAKTDSTVSTLASGKPDGSVDSETTIINLKKALANGPIIGQMFIANDFAYDIETCKVWSKTNGIYINGSYNQELDQMYSGKNPSVSGVKWGDIMLEDGSPSSHAVEVVGWGKDPTYGPYWIVKNSWGTNWSDEGYFRYGMYPNNKFLGLDVPVENAVEISTGKIIRTQREQGDKEIADLFGSCISFDPEDLLDDDPAYQNYGDGSVQPKRNTDGNEGGNGTSRSYLFLIIIGILIAGALLYKLLGPKMGL
jgi:hypothetical protein